MVEGLKNPTDAEGVDWGGRPEGTIDNVDEVSKVVAGGGGAGPKSWGEVGDREEDLASFSVSQMV